jgi:hypothetical protein
VQFQLDHGATKIIAPYVHVERLDNGWINAQIRLWHRTRMVLDARGESLPIIAMVALGWRCLAGATAAGLAPMWDALRHLAPAEVAVAAPKSHEGAKPDDRLVGLLTLVQELGRSYPVIACQQGLLGEACVAAGARGCECGIGWRQRCDLNQAMVLHRNPPQRNSPRGARPGYLADLGRSLQKAAIVTIRTIRRFGARLFVLTRRAVRPREPRFSAMPGGMQSSRELALTVLGAATTPAWAWGRLADKAAQGLALATKINAIAPKQVNTRVLAVVQLVAEARRQPGSARTRRTA